MATTSQIGANCYSLSEILAPISVDEFLQEYWGRQFLFIPPGTDKFSQYFSWQDLNQILSHHRLEPPRLRLEQVGKSREELDRFVLHVPSRRKYDVPYIDIPVLNSLLQQGATLVLDAIDEIHPAIQRTCENLSILFHTNPQVNLYAAWEESESFGLHWDDHDVFVLHLLGRKHWKIYETTKNYPLYRDFGQNSEKPKKVLFDSIIEPGSVLYIPRGHWHNVLAVNEPTLHLTIGVTTPTGIDLMQWMTDELRKEECLRRDLPIFGSLENARQQMDQIANIVNSRLSRNILDQYLQARRAKFRSRTYVSLPFSADKDSTLPSSDFTFSFTGTLHSGIFQEEGSDLIVVKCLGYEYHFSSATKELFERILAREQLRFSVIVETYGALIPEEDLRLLISSLLEKGFIYLNPLVK